MKRYDISASGFGGTEIDESESGDWVRYEDAKALRALLVEVYNHGETSDLHRRIGAALGAAPGDDAIPDQPSENHD